MKPLSESALRHEQNEEIQELHRQLKDKDRNFENYKKQRGGLEVFFRRVTETITPIEPLPKIDIKNGKGSKVSAIMQTSDSHMGAVQLADEIEGLNEFNPEICRERNLHYVDSALRYFHTLRSSYHIDTLHYFFTGDLISGDIHEELRVTNAFPMPVQVVEAAKIHSMQVGLVAQRFKNVVVHYIVADNHSRLTKKPQASEAGLNSMNYLVGHMMKDYLSRFDNVDFRLYPMTEKVVSVENMQYLLMHGHTIRGWMGVPWYGIERKAGKESTARLAAIMREQNSVMAAKAREIGFHKMVHGHFHVNFDAPLYSCAASIQGTTAYDHNSGRFSAPGQPAWLVHPKHGEFARTNFDLR